MIRVVSTLKLVSNPVSDVEEHEDEREQQAARHVYDSSSFLVACDSVVRRHLQQTSPQCLCKAVAIGK